MTQRVTPPSGEAIRAGEAVDLDLERFKRRAAGLRSEGGGYSHDEALQLEILIAEVERLRASSCSPVCATCGHPLSTHNDGPSEDCCRFTFGWGDKCHCGWPVPASSCSRETDTRQLDEYVRDFIVIVEKRQRRAELQSRASEGRDAVIDVCQDIIGDVIAAFVDSVKRLRASRASAPTPEPEADEDVSDRYDLGYKHGYKDGRALALSSPSQAPPSKEKA